MEANKEFIEAVEAGIDIETASHLVGIAPLAMFRLLERGKLEQERLVTSPNAKPKPANAGALELWIAIASARAKAIKMHVDVINMAGKDGDWKASKYALEVLHPQTYKSGTQGLLEPYSNNEIGEL